EEGRGHGEHAVFRPERIERERHRLPIRHRQNDQHDADRDEHEDVDYSLDHGVTLSVARGAGRAPYRCSTQLRAQNRFTLLLEPLQSSWSAWPGLRRSRSSLPVLKNGTHCSSTKTASPVRGLRPEREGRFLTEKRSEEHTSELQSRENLVCRLLLEKKNTPSHHRGKHINHRK